MSRNILVFIVLMSSVLYGQEPVWDFINTDNSELPVATVKCTTVDNNGAYWYGTYMGGVAVSRDNVWTIYNTSNSDLPHNYINSITHDDNNIIWVGTDGGGLAKFDGTTWTVFKTSNSGLPSNVVMSIYCDENGSIWVGTYFGGLANFDGENWEVYNEENSGLISNKIIAIAKDSNNVIWMGTQGGGIASFDGKNWNAYTEANSKLPNDYIYSIAVDADNNKWIGTGGGGVAVFNDVFWIIFNMDNSGLTDDNIRPIYIDEYGLKWIGTYIGGFNMFNGETWTTYDSENSIIPDDEITCITRYKDKLIIGTERTGVVSATGLIQEAASSLSESITAVAATQIMFNRTPTKETPVNTEQTSTTDTLHKLEGENKIMLVIDAADVIYDKSRINRYVQSFKIILKQRERINDTYAVGMLIYSSNYDLNPNKVVLTEKQKKSLQIKNVTYLEGESTFSKALTTSYDMIKADYDAQGNNHVIAATYKFIRDDEVAKRIIQENVDNDYIVFTLIAFDTKGWKMERKMKEMVPKGKGYYYALDPATIKDNWSATFQTGISLFRGDMDENSRINVPGIFGVAINKQVMSTGIFAAGVKGQFNIGKLQGSKKEYTFENNYFEGSVTFQAILNSWINNNFKFEKIRPYAFAGLGFISYRVLLRDGNGNVVNGYGYKITPGDAVANGSDPEKDKRATDMIFPLGLGANYKINDSFFIELEASSRLIFSDKLDGKINEKNDKYWFVTVGLTYKFNTKEFLPDILNK